MTKSIQRFSQDEYNRVLNEYSAKSKMLSHTACENILISAGASYEQAKNGAYVYIHHNGNTKGTVSGNYEQYLSLLNEFQATRESPRCCIRYLESLGYSYGQAKTAVYNYRLDKGLIRK
jgi:hypothetical protein